MGRDLISELGKPREDTMAHRSLIGLIGVAALVMTTGVVQAFDEAKYPNLKGQWGRFIVRGLPGQPSFDQTKGWGPYQQAPLTPEYQKILEESMADQEKGGLGNYSTARCLPGGMPRMMVAFEPQEYIITPETTYILIGENDHYRRIFTDGRDWPTDLEPSYQGYSIGKWLDADGDGRFDTLEVETRNFKGPRTVEFSGIALHDDNETIVRERIYLDKSDAEVMHNEITIIDHAFTRPWTVDKRYRRIRNVMWYEDNCNENNNHVIIGKENYFMSGDGYLMPARKGQSPPDLRYFRPPQK